MPSISVVVPVYKAERYLNCCIDSILCQIYQDFELILVDDGSPDNCGAICDEYAEKDNRVCVIHQENRGQAAARNRALSKARGQWVCFVDSDDFVHPQMLELLYQAAQAENCGISMCDYLEESTCPESFFSHKEFRCEKLGMDEASLLALFDDNRYPGWIACAKLIRKEIIEGYPFTEGRIYEDNEAVSHWICATKTIASIPEKLYFYRRNQESVTRVAFNAKKLDYLWALESIIGHYGSIGYGQMQKRFFALYVETSACYTSLLREQSDLKKAKQIAKNCIRFSEKQKIALTSQQRSLLWHSVHPRIGEICEIPVACITILREQGLKGLMKKVQKRLYRGDRL